MAVGLATQSFVYSVSPAYEAKQWSFATGTRPLCHADKGSINFIDNVLMA